MEQKYLDQAQGYDVLGPNYFAAREVAEKFMEKFEAEHFKPVIKKVADELYSQMQECLENYLLSDVESNIQGTIWRQIDDSVEAILSGKEWALKKYLLGERYDHGQIREAVAKVVPKQLQDARVKDLEAEVERLKEQVRIFHSR
ncbi:acylphosphatase [Bradyrhizobium sp. GM0.4]